MKDCYLGIYWSSRQASVNECAQKMRETFDYLCNVDNSFKQWYRMSKPKKGELVVPIQLDIKAIEKLVLDGQNYDDTGRLMEILLSLIREMHLLLIHLSIQGQS